MSARPLEREFVHSSVLHNCLLQRFNQFLGELKGYLKTNNKIETAHIPQRITPELPELEVKVQSKTEMIKLRNDLQEVTRT